MMMMMMNDDISRLEELLNPDALVETESGKVAGKGKVRLSETINETGKEYSIDVKNLPNDTLVIKADKFEQNKTISRKFRMRADYILVNEDEMVFVELKSGKIRRKDIKQQLMGAQCLVDYLICIGRRFFNDDNFLKTTSAKQHFVAIIDFNNQTGGFKSRKRDTVSAQQKNKSKPGHESKTTPNDSPEKMARIKAGSSSSNSLYYKKLLSGSG